MDSQVEQLLDEASSLITEFDEAGEIVDIDQALALLREASQHCPAGHDLHPDVLIWKSKALRRRYTQLGRIDDLNEAIVLAREVLALHPPGHPDRDTPLNNLASRLSIRYDKLGGIDDLNEAIVLSQEALTLCLPTHPLRSTALGNLATHLSTRYNRLGEIDDLNKAIVLARESLTLRPPGHPGRSRSFNNLALCLSTRYDQLGGIDDLNEAIVLAREALTLFPPGHPSRSTPLNNLAVHLSTRYDQLRGIDDLNEAIILAREALVLRPSGHPDRSTSLNNLANTLFTRYDQLGGIDYLNEAIILAREALVLLSCKHPNRSAGLNNLAAHLSVRYDQLDRIDDLNEAIILTREALVLRPPGYPDRSISLNNLANYLSVRYDKLGGIDDLDEAIVLGYEALALLSCKHPNWSAGLNNLANSLSTRYRTLGKVEDQENLFSLYGHLENISQTISSSDLSAAKSWVRKAERFHHSTTLPAYRTALRFLVEHLATLPLLPHHLSILKAQSSSLAVNAFSACLRKQSPTHAVELLEQGRGVFWSQLTRLRSPLDDVISSSPEGKALAEEFTHLTSLIRSAMDSPDDNKHDRICHLNFKLERVVSSIREFPNHSRFLLPPIFSDLQCAARDGPVVIVNASEYTCDALVVFADRNPVHISLPITKARVQEHSLQLQILTQRAKLTDVRKDLGMLLRDLWSEVVSHIVDHISATCPLGSRIWWCPTAEFTVLPLHAAGPYRPGQGNFSDLYISSYTPTLTALIRARRSSTVSNSTNVAKTLIAIGQANAIGASELKSVGTELETVDRRVRDLAMFMHIDGKDACISRVADELGRNKWVHFACHGIPNRKQPLESAFALHDGHFTIQHIIQCDLKNSEFAHLSACHTTVGDEESPDEVIHLASAMQFAGYRSVIGTMWAVDDEQANKFVSMFYKHMVDDSGQLDHTRAAFALWKTNLLVNVPLDQRVLYVHIGA